MRPVIAVVGRSNIGKTTLLESLIAELTRRGHRILAIKHTGEEIEIDQKGKDTWRFYQAGSEIVGISSSEKLALIKRLKGEVTPQEIARASIWDFDLVLAEGFKKTNNVKIEVYNGQGELLTPANQLIAVVSDKPIDVAVPRFARNDVAGIAALIEQWLASREKEDDIDLLVNGVPLALNPFTRKWLVSTLLGMISPLKGAEEIKNIHIAVRRDS